MSKYRKKPIVIDAWAIAQDNIRHAPRWVLEALNKGFVAFTPNGLGVRVRTLEGEMAATYGDMLIRGVAGELYPCKRTIFDATYEPVPE